MAERPVALPPVVGKGSRVMPIQQYIKDNSAFDPHDIHAMSMALENVCRALKLPSNGREREVMATRIIDLAKRGECDPIKLRDRVLKEANGEREP